MGRFEVIDPARADYLNQDVSLIKMLQRFHTSHPIARLPSWRHGQGCSVNGRCRASRPGHISTIDSRRRIGGG